MRLGIISDIHGNLPALEAVLEDVGARGLDEVWCLGDIVGYGASPDACTALVAEHCSRCLAGNHDLAVLDTIDMEVFSPTAARAVRWTRGNIGPDALEFLARLAPVAELGELALYHASPRDPVWEYVLWDDQAADCIASQSGRVSLVGHSHVALHFTVPDDRPSAEAELPAEGSRDGDGDVLDIRAGRWLVNPGSVGQPRDRDPRAAWLELDTSAWSATFRRTEYDIDAAADAIEATDLPAHLASRLYVGQ